MSEILPKASERIYAPYKINAVVEVLAEQGIAAQSVLAGSGLSAGQLHDPNALTSLKQFLTVCENALALSQDPAMPFEIGSRLHLSAYGMYGYALMSCLSLRDYFRLAVKYRRLATPPFPAIWEEGTTAVTWRFPDKFVSPPSAELRQFLFELQLAITVTHVQEVAGFDCPPLTARVPYARPPHAALYRRYLGCRCEFAQPETQLLYDSAILDRKPKMAHQLTASLVQETCDRLLGQAKISEGASGEVYRLLMAVPGNFPSMEEVAERLNTTPRTLRRRLTLEDTSFQQILDDVRSTLALEYLQSSKMSTDDIGMLLGFTDTANFRRALKRWTGKGLEELRAPAVGR
ncbi:AraC family transcriptional regulator [Herbaspirillum frisingense]|uniref:AraC family transcriptional regulator n=1 Tax=Herbaspirillum frisingense TaxID=92645 RepID=UPI001601C682|nr:AraC family transcriptional regulator [Herbaspirillum frisingense]QNB06014.1 AraC family transcriptional regulator [Herbaspirillum frisingense]